MRSVEANRSTSGPDSNIIYWNNSKVTITKSKETWPASEHFLVRGLHWYGSGQGQVAGSCEHNHEPSGSVKCE